MVKPSLPTQFALLIPPFLNLAALLIAIFVSLSPVPLLPHLGLLTVTHDHVFQSNRTPQREVDGPAVWMGLFGSCARNNSDSRTECTKSTFFPQYNRSVAFLPKSAASVVLKPPPRVLNVFIVMAICMAFPPLLSVTFVSLRRMDRNAETIVSNSGVRWMMFSSGVLSATASPLVFVILYTWYEKTRQDFNAMAESQDNFHFIASLGNAIIAISIAYVFLVVPVVVIVWDWWRSKKPDEPKTVAEDDSDQNKVS